MLKFIIDHNLDIFLIAETKLDKSFFTAQLLIKSFCAPYRFDRNSKGGERLLYIYEDTPPKILTHSWNSFKRVFTREISSWDETRPWMKSSLSMVKCLLLFTRFCRDEISSRDDKKKKRRVNTSSWDEILKWAYFGRMYSSIFSKFSMFEHNESMNIMKHKASL